MREVPLTPEPGQEFAWMPLADAGTSLRAGISLRAAGDLCHPERSAERGDHSSAAGCAEARARFLSRLGVAPPRLRHCRQVHSRTVRWLDGDPRWAVHEADGLMAGGGNPVLAVTVADCLPIFLLDRATGAFGILHSGWKGTGILGSALELLSARAGSRPRDLTVTIGPGIGSCCYAVDEERYESFRHNFGPESVRRGGQQLFLDLQAANLRLLEEAGVEDINVVRACTACTAVLSSCRRDGPAFAHMLAFIGEIPDRSRS
jgi:YfiH family protein